MSHIDHDRDRMVTLALAVVWILAAGVDPATVENLLTLAGIIPLLAAPGRGPGRPAS